MKNRVRTVRYFVEFWCDACASSFWITRERVGGKRKLPCGECGGPARRISDRELADERDERLEREMERRHLEREAIKDK